MRALKKKPGRETKWQRGLKYEIRETFGESPDSAASGFTIVPAERIFLSRPRWAASNHRFLRRIFNFEGRATLNESASNCLPPRSSCDQLYLRLKKISNRTIENFANLTRSLPLCYKTCNPLSKVSPRRSNDSIPVKTAG